MFKDLRNEAKLCFVLRTASPLSIKSGADNVLDPTLPNMQCLRTRYQGQDTVFMPGSSIKGVIRSRCERIISLLGGQACQITDNRKRCLEVTRLPNGSKQTLGEYVYGQLCPACQMFGSTSIGARVRFKDAYPVEEQPVTIGMRNGVGINRITGAAQRNALYDFEVVEEGAFAIEITLHNYALYQLKLLLLVLQDIDDGYVQFGGATSRGNGSMKVEQVKAIFRDYRSQPVQLLGFDGQEDHGGSLTFDKDVFFYRAEIDSLDKILIALQDIDLRRALQRRTENV